MIWRTIKRGRGFGSGEWQDFGCCCEWRWKMRVGGEAGTALRCRAVPLLTFSSWAWALLLPDHILSVSHPPAHSLSWTTALALLADVYSSVLDCDPFTPTMAYLITLRMKFLGLANEMWCFLVPKVLLSSLVTSFSWGRSFDPSHGISSQTSAVIFPWHGRYIFQIFS